MSGKKRRKIQTHNVPAPAPAPTFVPGREEEEAKKRVRRRAGRTGRQSTILAGRMNADRGILNTTLG